MFARKYANEEIPMTSKLFMYFKERGNSEKSATVYILSDCNVAIDIVTKGAGSYLAGMAVAIPILNVDGRRHTNNFSKKYLKC